MSLSARRDTCLILYHECHTGIHKVSHFVTKLPVLLQLMEVEQFFFFFFFFIYLIHYFVSQALYGEMINFCITPDHYVRCDMAFIEPMHRNKPNITYLLTDHYVNDFLKIITLSVYY